MVGVSRRPSLGLGGGLIEIVSEEPENVES